MPKSDVSPSRTERLFGCHKYERNCVLYFKANSVINSKNRRSLLECGWISCSCEYYAKGSCVLRCETRLVMNSYKEILAFIGLLLFFPTMCFGVWVVSEVTGCHDNSSSSSKSEYERMFGQLDDGTGNSKRSSSKESSKSSSSSSKKSYVDSRWPTFNSELLAIPKSNRYYNANKYIGQNHTVAGPVAKVYQANSSNGKPIFVNVGMSNDSSNWFTFVVWAEDLDSGLQEMLNDVDHGKAWLSVTGNLYSYEGRPQVQTGHGYVEYKWWTNVS